MNIKEKIKDILPNFILDKLRVISSHRRKKRINIIRAKYPLIIKKVQKKERINVVFLVIHDSVWKCEEVYRLFEKDPQYIVKIGVIPLINKGIPNMEVFNKTLEFFYKGNYNLLSSYDSERINWLDIKNVFQPDIVFFTNPHNLTFPKYLIANFTDTLTCYIPYTFDITKNFQTQYNQPFHNLIWKYFVETKYQYEFAKRYSEFSKGENAIISGFAGVDTIFKDNYKAKNIWKNCSKKNTIKIIWAPHHTIPNNGSGLDYSCFINYYEYFFTLLERNDNIQIAFKPHPLLKEKLYQDNNWGVTKTNSYYSKWDELPNGQLVEGGYLDLFYYSDAMILDSASFTVEYLYFNKPSLFTIRNKDLMNRVNLFGHKVFDFLYKANSSNDIDNFINLVLNKEDTLKNNRNKFVEEVLTPKTENSASKYIYNIIKKEFNYE